MKKILSNFISATAEQPFKQGTWIHLQAGISEALEALARRQIGPTYDSGKVYVLYGCVNSTTAPIYTVSAGAVFYGGEIYLVPAFTFTAASTAVGTITTTYAAAANADPVEFTDGANHNVHEIRTIVVSDGTSAGNFNYANWIFDVIDVKVSATLAATWSNLGAGSVDNAFYRKNIRDNTLSLGGVVLSSSNVGSTIFTLPVGYRPAHHKIVFAFSRPVTGKYAFGFVHIQTTGVVEWIPDEEVNSPTGTQLKLDGITVNLD
jgi:hypothetical protein